MKELLNNLLKEQKIDKETKKILETNLNEFVSLTEAKTKYGLAEQWQLEKSALISGIESKIEDLVAEEIKELKEDILSFRDLEKEYNSKILEYKTETQIQLSNDIEKLTKKANVFMLERIDKELIELKDDIQEQRKNNLGRKIFEAITVEYKEVFANDLDITKDSELAIRLEDTENALFDMEKRLIESERATKLQKILSPLNGEHKRLMGAMLTDVPTLKLDEQFGKFAKTILFENQEPLLESSETDNKKINEALENGNVISGDSSLLKMEIPGQIEESEDIIRIKNLAGISE